jgi:hypothetical protein
VFARQFQRLAAVFRFDRVLAVRFQQIMEELHVEIVVLDDENGLGHPSRPLLARCRAALAPAPAYKRRNRVAPADRRRAQGGPLLPHHKTSDRVKEW